MGLDQFGYLDKGHNTDWEEFAYWRKHPGLHGWMENLWNEKGRPILPEDQAEEEECETGEVDFNCIALNLTLEDIERLEADIINDNLPQTTGFFFGADYNKDDPSERAAYEAEKNYDLEFCTKAKEHLNNGFSVFYDSWW